MKKQISFVLGCIIFAAVCNAEELPSSIPDTDSLTLIWHDEFEVDGAPDPTRWTFEHGFVRNQELQWYQPQNAQVVNGVLQIEGRREQVANPHYNPESLHWRENRAYAAYTSACLETRQHFSFRYGRLEVAARIPTAYGAWPAIWTLGNRAGWPACGEIDLLEYYRVPAENLSIHHQAQAERTVPVILANACWMGADGRDAWDTGRIPYEHFTAADPHWAERFHVWRMDWTPEVIRLYVDDELLNEIPTHVANPQTEHGFNPFVNRLPGFGHYILLNLAIGACGGTPDDSAFPLVYAIDYVRVYQFPNHPQ